MKRIALIGSILCSLAPSAAFAQMRYSAFDASYIDVELDGGITNVDGDGFEIGGSYELNDKIFLLGKWQDQSLDFGIDGRAIELGAGLHHPLGETVDFVATLTYIDLEVELGNITADDDGLAIGGGIRARVAESFEVDAGLKLVDLDSSGSDTGFNFGGRWYFNETMAIGAAAEFNDNADTLRIGFRAEF
jgi:hypothetical protein